MSDLKDFIIEDSVLKKYIGKEKNVVIPDSVTSIGDSAFYGCTSLTNITIPDSVTSIGDSAFYGCKSLTSITLPNSDICFGDEVFYRCNKLGYIITNNKENYNAVWKRLDKKVQFSILMKSVEAQITNQALNPKIKANKKKLIAEFTKADNEVAVDFIFSLYKVITLEELDEYIEKSADAVKVKAFLLEYKSRCYSAEMQEQAERVRTEKELGCRNLTLQDWKKLYLFNKTDNGIVIRKYKGEDPNVFLPQEIDGCPVVAIDKLAFGEQVLSVTISDRVKSIGERAFCNCVNLKSVILSNSVTDIGDKAFYNCKSLESITITDSVTNIGASVFSGCESLTTVTVGNGAADIGNWAFSRCSSLKSIILGDSVTSIGREAFDWCVSLEAISIPKSITNIGGGAFNGCGSLKSITVPGSVKKIGASAFSSCDSLTSVSIGDGVKNIGKWAFSRCSSLKSIILGDSVTSIGVGAFVWCGSDLKLHAPAGSYAEKYAKENNIPFVAE